MPRNNSLSHHLLRPRQWGMLTRCLIDRNISMERDVKTSWRFYKTLNIRRYAKNDWGNFTDPGQLEGEKIVKMYFYGSNYFNYYNIQWAYEMNYINKKINTFTWPLPILTSSWDTIHFDAELFAASNKIIRSKVFQDTRSF